MEVHDHHVGTELGDAIQGFGGTRGHAHDLETLAPEQGAGRGEERLAVIDDHHAQRHGPIVARLHETRIAGSPQALTVRDSCGAGAPK